MSNPEVKIRLSLDGAQQVQAGAQNAAASMEKLGASSAKVGQAAQISGQQVAQVSAQLQDLFIQIQGGQAPLTALLQQGSQLSTVFGGVGSAARAVAGTVTSMVNPFTLAATAAGVLAAGYFKGAQEAQEFNKSLIMTGNAAGVTAARLSQLSASIAGITGSTQGRAAEVLNQLAASGRVGAENLQRFTQAAIALERAGGAAADETAKAFADLAKSPLEAVRKLNEATNFLTASQIRQIQSLEDQGKTTEAAKAAQEAYAAALEKRTPAMVQNLGLVERAWLSVKDAAKGAGDAILDIGRAPNALQAEIKSLEARIAANNRDAQGGGQTATEAIAKGNAILTARLRLLQQAAGWEAQSAASQAQQAQNAKTLDGFLADGEKYLNNKARMQREITQETERGQKLVEAGLLKQAELDTRLAAIREKYADKNKIDIGAAFEADRNAAEEWAKFYTRFSDLAAEAAGKVGNLTKSQVELAKFLQSPAYANGSEPARQLALQQAYAAITAEQLAAAQEAGAKSAAEAAKEHLRYIDTLEKSAESVASQVLKLQDEEAAASLVAAKYGSLAQSIEMVTIKRLQEKQIAMMGNEEAVLAIQREIEQRQKLIGLIGNKDAREAGEKSAKQAAEDWQRAANKIEDAITDSLMRGFESGKGFAENLKDTVENMFKTMVLRPIVSAVVQPFAQSLASATGMSAISGGANALGAASGIGSFYGLGGLVSGAGNLVGSSTISAFGSGLGMSSAQAASAAAAYNSAGMTGVGSAIGAGSSLAAVIPYVAAAAAIISIAKSLDDSGTIHTGASSEYSSAKGLATGMGLYGVGSKAGAYGVQTEAMTTEIAKGVVGILDSTAASFGKQAGYQAAAAFADDTSKDGAWGALSIKIGEKVIEGFGQDGNGRWPGKSFADGQAGTQEYLAAVSADVRAALDQIGLPQWATTMLNQLGEAPSLDQLAQTVATINATQAALVGLGDAMPAFASLTNGATQTLLEAFGGINNLASTAQGFYQNFYSEAERAARTTELVTKELADLGFAMPTTREGFRALVEQQLAAGDAGAKTAAELLKLQGAFASVVAETSTLGEVFDQTAADIARAAETMAEAGRRALASLAEDQGSIMVELLTAQGKTAEAQALARQNALAKITGGLSESDALAATAAYDYNQALRDQVAALLAATDAQKQAASAAAEAERTAQAAAEAAISAAQQRAAAIASEGYGLTTRLLQAQGNTAELRRRELEALDPTNRALLEQIFALEDQQSQAQSAAAALQGVNSALSGLAGTRVNLQAELLTLQGDTAGAARIRREAELATLTAGMSAQDAARIAAAYDLNTALQQQIDETRSAQEAAEAMAQAQARAADEAQRASEQVTRAWQGVTDSIYDEVARIRGLFDGNTPASLAAAQTQFTLTNARASAGDQEAAKLLPALSRTLIDLATAQATTLAEVERVRAATAASLEQTGSLLSSRYGLSIPKLATGTNYVPRDMLAMLHEGEQVVPKAYNPAASGGADQQAMLQELRALRAEVAALKEASIRTAGATEKSRDVLVNVTRNGDAMQTEAAT